MLIYDIIPPSKIIQRNSRKKKIRVLNILKPTLSSWLIVLLILQIVAGVLFLPPIEEAQAWLSGYTYQKQIHLTGYSGAGTNYQVKLLIGKTDGAEGEHFDLNGHCLDTFNDIRFRNAADDTLIDYWVEKVENSGTSKLATVWVEVRDNLDTNKDIYIYYGKDPDSSASNGSATFQFFDDFEDGNYTINPTWTVSSGSWSGVNNYLEKTSTGWEDIYTSFGADEGVWEYKFSGLGGDPGNANLVFPMSDDTSYTNSYSYYDNGGTLYLRKTISSVATNLDSLASGSPSAGWHNYKVTRDSSGSMKVYIDDVEKLSATNAEVSGSNYIILTFYASGQKIDDFRVRKYLSPNEPYCSGSEPEQTEGGTAPTGTINSAAQKTDASGKVDISIEVNDPQDNDCKSLIEYTSDGTCTSGWVTTPNVTLVGPATADVNDTGGAPDINNSAAYQVGSGVDTRIVTAGGDPSNTVQFDWDSKTDVPNANGDYCIRLTVNDGAEDQATPATLALTLDNVLPAVSEAVHLEDTTPNAGENIQVDTAWTETNPNVNEFDYKLGTGNYQGWSAGDSNTADPSPKEFTVTLNGDDYISGIKARHTDDFGNVSTVSENTTNYYVVPYTPHSPTVDNGTASTVDVTVNKHSSEATGLEYAIQCVKGATTKWIQANGTLGDSAVWKTRANWGTSNKITVSGLVSPVQDYVFKTKSRNSQDNSAESSLSVGASLPGWLTSWGYRKKITITGQSGAGTNYQVKLRVGESSGVPEADRDFHIENHDENWPNDIRFTDNDGETLLDHWLETTSGTSPNRLATFWVEVKDNLDSNQNIYIYYGKSGESSASDGDATFQFFNDFEGEYDSGEWYHYPDNILAPEAPSNHAAWSSVWKEGSIYHMYYTISVSGTHKICHATSTDKINWTKDAVNNPVLEPSASGWDSSRVWCPMVWKEDTTWYMLYTGDGGGSINTGLATSSDGINWNKDTVNNPVLSPSEAWESNHAESWGIIKIGSTYYLWYGNIVSPTSNRAYGLATSTNLTEWTKDTANNPIIENGRFCPDVFKYGSYYYLIVTHYDAKEFELYRDTNPTFYPDDREFMGIKKFGTGDSLDTPWVLTDDITRMLSEGDELWVYYNGTCPDDVSGTCLLKETGIEDALISTADKWRTNLETVTYNSTDMAYSGLQSMKLHDDESETNVTFTGGQAIAIQYRMYVKTGTGVIYPLSHGNDSYRVNLYIAADGSIKYMNAAGSEWVDTGTDITFDTWILLGVQNFDWAGHTVDITLNGSVIQSSADLNSSSGHNNLIRIKNVGAAQHMYVDDFLVRKYASSEPGYSSAGSEATLTIQFSSTSSSGAESVTQAQLELNLSGTSGQNVSVDYAVTGTATGSGTDYTLSDGTATITAGNTTTTIDAVIIDDSIDESDETIIVTITNSTNAGLGANTVHTYTITDNDTAGITVNPTSGLTTTEAGGTDTFTVVLDTQPSADVTIGISSSDTTEGTVSPSSLIFTSSNWDTAQTVTATGVDDSVDDSNIAYTIITAATTSADSNYNGIDPSDISMSNSDDDESAPSGGGGMPSEWHNPPAPPSQGFSILINDDTQFTNILIVALNLRGGSDTERMSISNFSDFRNASQIPYQKEIEWNLCSSDLCLEGEYTIYAKFYTQYGQPSQIVSDSIIYQKEKEPIVKIPEIIKKVPEEIKKIPEIIEKIPEILEPLIPEFLKPEKEEEEKQEEIIVISEETPLVMQGQWNLLPEESIKSFVLTPLPKEIRKLAEKFPELGETLKKVGITKITDIEKLRTVKLTLPGLTERVGLPTVKVEAGKFALPVGVPVANLSPQIKKQIPTEIVFTKTGGELIDFNIALTIDEKGKPQQKIATISGKPLQLVVKPDKPVKSVKGYVVFKSKKPKPSSFQFPLNHLVASLVFANPVFAQKHNPVEIEERLVLLEFEYTDPDEDGIYTAEIQAPLVEGEYEIITVMDYEDPKLGKKEIRLITVVDPEGYIYTTLPAGKLRITGAIVSIYWLNPETKQYEPWPAKEYQQENPQITDDTGKYSFLVPEGSYYLKVETPGYLVYDGKPFQVKEGSGVHVNIELKTKYWFLKIIDWKIILLIVVILLLLYNFYRDKVREKLMQKS